jgi:hypothetical protein
MTQPEPSERVKTFLSILIALTAVTAALSAWQATRIGLQAAAADGKALTAAMDEASTEIGISADVFGNLTDAREFLIHRENAKGLLEEYQRHPEAPARWNEERQSEMIRARTRHLQLIPDFLKSENGLPVFESRRYRETTRALTASQKAIDPAPFLDAAARHRLNARRLVELNALFSLAIFFFTVALKTEVRRKPFWIAAGIGLYLIATASAVVRILF